MAGIVDRGWETDRDAAAQLAAGGMAAEMDPRLNPTAFWQQAPDIIVPYIRAHRQELGPMWAPRPIKISVGRGPDPKVPFQAIVHEQLMERLLRAGLGNENLGGIPPKDASPDKLSDMAIVYGNGTHDQIIRVWDVGRKYPKPRGLFFAVNTANSVQELTSIADFWNARAHLIRKVGNNGLILAPDSSGKHVGAALIANMQGNWILLTGDPEAMWNAIVLNTLSHNAMPFVTGRQNIPEELSWVSWKDWCNSPIPAQVASAAHIMGTQPYSDGKPLIFDKVDLAGYADALQERTILITIGREETGFGESMRAGVDPKLRVVLATVSGGGKVNVSADPHDRHFSPVGYITADGYGMLSLRGSPYSVEQYHNSSVETRIAAILTRLGAEFQSGHSELRDPKVMEAWLQEELQANSGKVEVLPEGKQPKFLYIDHNHHAVAWYNPDKVEMVHPDGRRYPGKQDGACGTEFTQDAVIDGALQSEVFTTPGPEEHPLHGKHVGIVEDGHGVTWMTEDREQLTQDFYDREVMILGDPCTGPKEV